MKVLHHTEFKHILPLLHYWYRSKTVVNLVSSCLVNYNGESVMAEFSHPTTEILSSLAKSHPHTNPRRSPIVHNGFLINYTFSDLENLSCSHTQAHIHIFYRNLALIKGRKIVFF